MRLTNNLQAQMEPFILDCFRERKIGMWALVTDPMTLIETNFMSSWLWLGATIGIGFALFSSAVAAVVSVLKSASEVKRDCKTVLLLVSNSSSAIGQIIAFVCWVIQFYQYLTHNVLAAKDLHTNDSVSLGFSFYLILMGIIIVTANLIILCTVVPMERIERRPVRREDVDG